MCLRGGIVISKESKEKKTLTDPRKPNDILHKLIDIVTIIILAVMCGTNGWNEIELIC
jgi:hypothetical protein